jgi:tetratricopeptide (TPR) repeat protein
MPKVIKKRPAKKKPGQEDEVKSAALQALEKLKNRQKQAIIIVSVILAIFLLYVIFMFYSSSVDRKAYALEKEAYNTYYGVRAGDSMSEADRWKKALELYKKAVDVKATPTAMFYLGNCYFNLGQYDNAIKEYSRFADKFGREKGVLPLVYQKMASAYFKVNQNEKALETLGKLANVENGIFKDTALVYEARYYEGTGEKAKALEKYREIISGFPTSPWSVEASAKVAADTAAGKAQTPEDAAKTTEAPAPESGKTGPVEKAPQ